MKCSLFASCIFWVLAARKTNLITQCSRAHRLANARKDNSIPLCLTLTDSRTQSGWNWSNRWGLKTLALDFFSQLAHMCSRDSCKFVKSSVYSTQIDSFTLRTLRKLTAVQTLGSRLTINSHTHSFALVRWQRVRTTVRSSSRFRFVSA